MPKARLQCLSIPSPQPTWSQLPDGSNPQAPRETSVQYSTKGDQVMTDGTYDRLNPAYSLSAPRQVMTEEKKELQLVSDRGELSCEHSEWTVLMSYGAQAYCCYVCHLEDLLEKEEDARLAALERVEAAERRVAELEKESAFKDEQLLMRNGAYKEAAEKEAERAILAERCHNQRAEIVRLYALLANRDGGEK
jgi:hypothetical protein